MKDYIVISKEILTNDSLTYLQKMVLAKISNLDNDKGCFASNKYFARLLSSTPGSISKAINSLKADGYIQVTLKDNTDRSITLVKKDRGGVVKGQGGLSKRTGSSVTINIDTKIDNNKIYKSFIDWWKLYDKKVGKDKALKFWTKKLDESLVDEIMDHTKRYVKSTDKQFRKNPYTYLFNATWEDEIMNEVVEYESNPYVDAQRLKAYNIRMGTNYQSIDELRTAND